MLTELDSTTQFLLVILILILGGMIAARWIIKLSRFRRDLMYVNMEIQRTIGAEREHWKREKRRLWLRFLPFCRK